MSLFAISGGRSSQRPVESGEPFYLDVDQQDMNESSHSLADSTQDEL